MTPKKKVVVDKIAKKWLSTDEAASYIGMGKSFIVELRKERKATTLYDRSLCILPRKRYR